MEDVAIYGAGGFGSEVQDILRQGSQYRPVAYLDSDTAKHGTIVGELPVLGGLAKVEELQRQGVHCIVVAIGDNLTRAAHAETLYAHGMRLISAIHPLASISPSAKLGEHVIIGPRATVCVHVSVGSHAVLSAGAICDHNAEIGIGAFLGPAVRLAGGVKIGEFARLEIGATVIPGRMVGNSAQVEAGAVVIRDVPPGARVAGIPATPCHAFGSRFVPEKAHSDQDAHVEVSEGSVG
jgi:sugar O-acyltransferase (sialic acid O-acetyltransferase NeuD family)